MASYNPTPGGYIPLPKVHVSDALSSNKKSNSLLCESHELKSLFMIGYLEDVNEGAAIVNSRILIIFTCKVDSLQAHSYQKVAGAKAVIHSHPFCIGLHKYGIGCTV